MKTFNTTGLCVPEKHYMADLTERVARIRKMIDAGKYFCMNRARQYGKTTTLEALRRSLADEYTVISLDFQGIGDAGFRSEEDFSQDFSRLLLNRQQAGLILPDKVQIEVSRIAEERPAATKLSQLFHVLSEWCSVSERPIVLMIDEVDSATNNQVFLDFLAQLRQGYLDREALNLPAFRSVILAGVTDVKHLKGKLRDEDQHKVNSPWNIAADFDIDMSLSADDIAQMLEEYLIERRTDMDLRAVSKAIHDASGGYPYLVSKLCQIIDETILPEATDRQKPVWTVQDVEKAVSLLVKKEGIPLFDSLIGKLENYPELNAAIASILMRGESVDYLPYDSAQSRLRMYGFLTASEQKVVISNRIFESVLYDYYLGKEQSNAFRSNADLEKSRFVQDGHLNVRLILERFVETYHEILGDPAEAGRFKEKDGRELFLLYLKPIINGIGNYYIEAQTRDQKRTDVIVDYLGEQYVIELKIWHGERYNEEGERQIAAYLDYFKLDTGYMLSFNFNKKKETGVKRVTIGDKVLFEGTV